MGQGSDSCGGHDWDYDAYDEGLEKGEWTTRSGGGIHVTKMTVRHLKGALRMVEGLAEEATLTDEKDKWEDWITLFESELASRPDEVPTPKSTKPPAPVRGTTVTMICHCKQEYQAREADLKRGWGKTCSKRCAAIKREYGRPDAKRKPV